MKFIKEKLINILYDVDNIYDMFFKKDCEEILKSKKLTKNMFKEHIYSTDKLESPECIEANKYNPCKILINSLVTGNAYNPLTSIIYLGLGKNLLNFVDNYNGDLTSAFDSLTDTTQKNNFLNEFKEYKIKSSIYHELVHWIDDTTNNRHIHKKIKKQYDTKIPIPMVNNQNFEIQSQIHAIYVLKQHNSDIWNNISFDEMINLLPSLTVVKQQMLKSGLYNNWKRKIIRRMHREGLLGKNM